MSRSRKGARGEQTPSLRLRWSTRAEADLEAIGDYIARDNPEAAERWVTKILEQARRAADAPLAGRVVPEFRQNTLREFLLRSYRIVYRIHEEEVQVITVFEGHRRFPSDVDIDSD